jgi:hypothetical protein
MLRWPTGVARAWGQRCLELLADCARTLPTNFYRGDEHLKSSASGAPKKGARPLAEAQLLLVDFGEQQSGVRLFAPSLSSACGRCPLAKALFACRQLRRNSSALSSASRDRGAWATPVHGARKIFVIRVQGNRIVFQ